MTPRRFVITCISHADRSKFKTFKEVEDGDTIAGWSSRELVRNAELSVRFCRNHGFDNTLRLGRICDIAHLSPFRMGRHLRVPFKLFPRLRITDEGAELMETGDYLIQTENSLLVVKDVTPHVQ